MPHCQECGSTFGHLKCCSKANDYQATRAKETKKWSYEWPKQQGYYWYKGEDGIIEITHFDGEDYEHGFNVCWTEKPLGKEDFKNVKWYGPINPPKN